MSNIGMNDLDYDYEAYEKFELEAQDSRRYRTSYVDVAGGIVSGLVLSQLVYWCRVTRDKKTKKPNGTRLRMQKHGKLWVVKSHAEWYDEARISVGQATRAIAKLEHLGLIETKLYKFMGTPTTYIWVNMEAIRRETTKVLDKGGPIKTAEWPPQNDGMDSIKTVESPPQNDRMDSIKIAESYITENTTENTTERVSENSTNLRVPNSPGSKKGSGKLGKRKLCKEGKEENKKSPGSRLKPTWKKPNLKQKRKVDTATLMEELLDEQEIYIPENILEEAKAHKKLTVEKLALFWWKMLTARFDELGDVTQLSGLEKKRLHNVAKKIKKDPLEVFYLAIMEWSAFTAHCEETYSAFKSPKVPQLFYVEKYTQGLLSYYKLIRGGAVVSKHLEPEEPVISLEEKLAKLAVPISLEK